MLKGRFYSRDFSTDSTDAIVINQGTADLMGWKEPLGQSFFLDGKDFTVIGISDNIKISPFKIRAVGGNALIFKFGKVNDYIFVKYDKFYREQALDITKQLYQKFNPGHDFEFFYLSDSNVEAVDNSKSISFLFWSVTFLGFFISSIGLFGLAIHSTLRRVKEIGIRKSFGAGNRQVYMVIVNEFMRLVFIANLIGLPLAWILVNWTFQFFAYHIHMSVWVFVFAFIASFLIALITIGFIAYRAVRQNPVDSLRYE